MILDEDLHSSVQTLCTTGTENCLGFIYFILLCIINDEQQFKAFYTWLNYLHSEHMPMLKWVRYTICARCRKHKVLIIIIVHKTLS